MEHIEINGRYRLNSLIAEGGMGAVYRGTHIAVGRPVAVKLVHAFHAGNPQVVRRLEQEARATGAIASENVVQVLDAGEDPKLGLFLVMELLAGEDLERRLEREKRLSVTEAVRIADQAARGLGHAHVRGVIHRDLKPANIFLCEVEDGPPIVKIVDFGIAKLVRESVKQDDRLTSGGCVVGTPQYMSPEQAQGLETIDSRTDVYSLGAVLYEMLVGEPPVPDLENYEQKILHIVTKPRPRLRDVLPDVDPELDELVADMMAFDPEDRPEDMRAVRARLGKLSCAARTTAISAPPPPPALTRADNRRFAWGAAVITAVAIGIVGFRAQASSPVEPATAEAAAPHVLEAKSMRRVSAGVAVKATSLTPAPVTPAASSSAPVASPPSPKPRPLPAPAPIKPAPPPTAVTEVVRPFGGTGISHEF